MKNLPSQVASKIKNMLMQQHKTAEKLAYEIGMSKGYLSEFLNGKKDITLKNLQRLAEGLDVDPKEFFNKWSNVLLRELCEY